MEQIDLLSIYNDKKWVVNHTFKVQSIYSLLTKKKINHLYGITGEINLQGNVTKIGGLDLKIVGGIRGGVKSFLFPQENIEDFNKFLAKNKNNKILEGITFQPVSNILDVLDKILV